MALKRVRAIAHELPVLLAILFFGAPAVCDEGDQNKSVATDLFDTGVRKMQEGECDHSPVGDRAICSEAREAFRRAYALYPAGLGALRNLAYVEKDLGLIASAARNFRELSRRAPLDPSPARRLWADFARKESEALAPRIPRLTIEITGEPPAGLTLVLDDRPLPEAAWETALEVEPGKHTLRAEAPHHAPFEASFELAEREQKHLAVPLQEEAEAPSVKTEQVKPSARPRGQAPPRRLRIAPLIVGGAGVVTIGVGLGLGYVAIQKRKDACPDDHFCEPDELESGRNIARASTIVTSVGAATLAGGLIWYFLSAPREQKQISARVLPSVGTSGAGIEAYGNF